MDSLRIEPFFHAGTGTWTYVVHREGDAVVIDPVLDYDPKSGRIGTDSLRAVQGYIAANGLGELKEHSPVPEDLRPKQQL